MGTLHCNIVIQGCGNVAGTSFSQRCENNLLTMLYNVVCLLGRPFFYKLPGDTSFEETPHSNVTFLNYIIFQKVYNIFSPDDWSLGLILQLSSESKCTSPPIPSFGEYACASVLPGPSKGLPSPWSRERNFISMSALTWLDVTWVILEGITSLHI